MLLYMKVLQEGFTHIKIMRLPAHGKKIKRDLTDEKCFEVLAPMMLQVNKNKNKIVKNQNLKMSKLQNNTFVRTT